MARKTANDDAKSPPPPTQPIKNPDRKRKRNTAKEIPAEIQPNLKRKQIPYQTSTQTLKEYLKSFEEVMEEDLRWNFSQWLSKKLCGRGVSLSSLTDASSSSSSLTNALIISTDILLLFMLVYITVVNEILQIRPPCSKEGYEPLLLRFVSAAFNACLGLAYVGCGIWIIFEEHLPKVSSSHFGAVLIVQGLIWSMLGLKLSLSRKRFPKVSLWIILVVSVLFAGPLCVLSLIVAVVNKEVTIYTALNIMSYVIFLRMCIQQVIFLSLLA